MQNLLTFAFSRHVDPRRNRGGNESRHPRVDPVELRIKELIVRAGDNTSPSFLGEHLADLCSDLLEPNRTQFVVDTLFRCIVALPAKPPLYATLIALLARQRGDFLQISLSKLKSEITSSFLRCDYYALKYLLRLAMELSNCNIIPAECVYGLYETILTETMADADTPQHVLDYYCIVIISCLIFGESQKYSDGVLKLLEKHVSKRNSLSWLSPFILDAPEVSQDLKIDTLDYTDGKKDSLHVLYDLFVDFMKSSEDSSGALSSSSNSDLTNTNASNECIGRMRFALKPYQSTNIHSRLFGSSASPLPTSVSGDFEWFDEANMKGRTIHDLVTFRGWLRSENEIRGALGLDLYQYPSSLKSCNFTAPKPTTYIFPKIRTSGEGKHALSDLERWFFQDFALDIVHFFRSAHADIPKHMSFCRHVTEHFDFFALIVETLILDFIRVVPSSYPTAHHGVIILDFVQQSASNAATLGEAAYRLFNSVPVLRLSTRMGLVDWLSYHLSNTEYKWNWQDWAATETKFASSLKNSETDFNPHTAFIRELITAMMRLSYYDRIASLIAVAVPDRAEKWLPKKADPTVTSNDALYQSELATTIYAKVKSRPANVEDVLNAALDMGANSEDFLRILVRAILMEGSVSITMLQATLHRYTPLLLKIAAGEDRLMPAPSDGAAFHVLRAVLDCCDAQPQLFEITVSIMLQERLLRAEDVVTFMAAREMIDLAQSEHFFIQDSLHHTVRHVTQSHLVLEQQMINMWRLSCKVDPDANPLLLAERQAESLRGVELLEKISSSRSLLKPFFLALFSSFLDLASSSSTIANENADPLRIKTIACERLVFLATRNLAHFASVQASLDPIASSLDDTHHTLYENLCFLAGQY